MHEGANDTPRSQVTLVTPLPRERGSFSTDSKESADGQALTAAEAGTQRTTSLRGSGTQDAFPSPAEAGDTHARLGLERRALKRREAVRRRSG